MTQHSQVLPGGGPESLSTGPGTVAIARTAALIGDSLGIDVDDTATDLLASGIIDSLAFVSLLLAIEREFGISIDVDRLDLSDFQSVERIARFIMVEITRSNTPTDGDPS